MFFINVSWTLPQSQRIYVPWRARDLLNYKALFLPGLKPCLTSLGRLVPIHNPTHRNLDWLLRGILPSHDYSIVTRQARQLPGGPIPQPPDLDKGNRWTVSFPDPSTNDQEMDQLRLIFRGLLGEITDAFLSK